MKKITTFLALLFLGVIFGQVQTFKFEDNLTNEGSPLITLNGSNETFVDGLPGKGRALQFNQPTGTPGTFRALASIPNMPQGNSERSISFWLKVAAPANNTNDQNSDIFYIGSVTGSTSPFAGFGFRRAPASTAPSSRTKFEIYNGTTVFGAVESNNSEYNNLWRFFSINYFTNGSGQNVFRIYIDGLLVTTNSITGSLNTNTALRLGGGTLGNRFEMDNFQIYDSALAISFSNTNLEVYQQELKPSVPSPQTLCSGAPSSAIVVNEFPGFSSVKCYTHPTNNTFISSATTIYAGTFYISQTLNGVESERTPVVITTTTVPPPTGNANQTLPSGSNLINIVLNGSSVSYYSSASDAAIDNNQLPNNTALINGRTYYGVSFSNGCRSASFAVTITIGTLSNSDFDGNLKFSLYPNPANNILNIELATELKSVEIYSLQGQKVLTSNKNQVDVSGLSKGIYMVRVEDIDNGVSAQKMVKE